MYLTEDQSPSTKGHLSMARHRITIGKFVRWLFLEFVLSEFLIVLHWWSFEKIDLLRFGVRSFCSGYGSFCNLVCLYYFQLFILWLRLLIFTTITVRWFCNPPYFESEYFFFAVAEGWLLLDIGWFVLFLLIHTYSLCRVEPVVRFPARGLT